MLPRPLFYSIVDIDNKRLISYYGFNDNSNMHCNILSSHSYRPYSYG